MSGEVDPVNVGLYSRSDLKQVMRYKTIFRIIDKHNKLFQPVLAFLFDFVSYIMNENLVYAILIGVPNSLLLALYAHYFCNIMIFQFAYFHFICKYLKLKLKNLNKELRDIQVNKNFTRIPRILRSLDALYREIEEYNVTYWSKFMFIIWLIWGAACLLWLYRIIPLVPDSSNSRTARFALLRKFLV